MTGCLAAIAHSRCGTTPTVRNVLYPSAIRCYADEVEILQNYFSLAFGAAGHRAQSPPLLPRLPPGEFQRMSSQQALLRG
jgi:hypothetical protein